MKPYRKIAFFLTGHGFGHAVRNSAILNALPPEAEAHIFTSVPESFFAEELRRPWNLVPCELDCGCLQKDTVEIDVEGTLARYLELESSRAEQVRRYAPMLRSLDIDLVVGDVPPLAFPIAKAAGVPSWALYNFTWADIYRPYLRYHARYGDMLRRMEDDYAQADLHLRLFPAMESAPLGPLEEAGMLSRPGESRRAFFAKRFGLDPGKKWCMVYVGSFGLDGVDWHRLDRFPEWEFMGLYPLHGAPANYRLLQKDPGFRYSDLTASCDAVLGKLGYGLVTECLALGKPVLFLGRKDFEEFFMLKRLVESRGLGMEISLQSFLRLDFRDELNALAARTFDPMPAIGLERILGKMGYPAANP